MRGCSHLLCIMASCKDGLNVKKMVYVRWFYRNFRRLVIVALGTIVLLVCWIMVTRQQQDFRFIQTDGQRFVLHSHDHQWRKITVITSSRIEDQPQPSEAAYSIPLTPEDVDFELEVATYSSSLPTTDSKILLVHSQTESQQPKLLKVFLQSQRVSYDVYIVSPLKPPVLTKSRGGSTDLTGRYKIIVVFGFSVDRTIWTAIKKYCISYNARVISITSSSDVFSQAEHSGSTLNPHLRTSLIHLQVEQVKLLRTTKCSVLSVTKPDTSWMNLPNDWVISFSPDTAWYSSQGCPMSTKLKGRIIQWVDLVEVVLRNSVSQTVSSALIDCGSTDGVRKVFIGLPLSFSLTKLLLLDVIHYLSDGQPVLRFFKKRWLQIDVDDGFVAPSGLKMTEEDVEVG